MADTPSPEPTLFFVVATYASVKRAGLPEVTRFLVAALSEDDAFETFERENPAHITRSVSVLTANSRCVRLEK